MAYRSRLKYEKLATRLKQSHLSQNLGTAPGNHKRVLVSDGEWEATLPRRGG